MLLDLCARWSTLRPTPIVQWTTFLLLPLLPFGACTTTINPEAGKTYRNPAAGYEFRYAEIDEGIQIELKNIGNQVLNVESIGLYTIKDGSIILANRLAIEDRLLKPQTTTFITFPREDEGFLIMNSAGSFVTGAMFEVRYQ